MSEPEVTAINNEYVGKCEDHIEHPISDYRVAHLLEKCSDESFRITNVVDGEVIFTGDNGTELQLPLKLPRKIIINAADTVTTITKMGMAIRKKTEKQMALELK
jgi:hypothetical protein